MLACLAGGVIAAKRTSRSGDVVTVSAEPTRSDGAVWLTAIIDDIVAVVTLLVADFLAITTNRCAA